MSLSTTKAGRDWMLVQSLILWAHAINRGQAQKNASSVDILFRLT